MNPPEPSRIDSLPHTWTELSPKVREGLRALHEQKQREEQAGQPKGLDIQAQRYADAVEASKRLSDAQKIELAAHLVDAADYDAPDLRDQAEGALKDILDIIRGEV